MLRLAVRVPQSGEVDRSPGARVLVVDELVDDAVLLRALRHRHRKPARFAVEPDLAAVLVTAALELDVVQQDEQIDLGHAVQVAEPRQIVRLVNRDDHRSCPSEWESISAAPRTFLLRACRPMRLGAQRGYT